MMKKLIRQQHLKQLFREVFSDLDGFKVALKEREEKNQKQPQFVYGEIRFAPYNALLASIKPKPDMIFCDLGAGVGKPTILSAAQYPFKKCYGIELSEGLYKLSQQALKRAKAHRHAHQLIGETNIEFHHGSFLTVDFFDADIVFINATAFLSPLWESILERLTQLKPGTIVVSIGKCIHAPGFQSLEMQKIWMTWGDTFAYIHVKSRE